MIKEFKSGDMVIKIDYDKCTGAGNCIEECPVDIYEIKEGKAIVKNLDECIECCVCIDACPNGAIEHSSC